MTPSRITGLTKGKPRPIALINSLANPSNRHTPRPALFSVPGPEDLQHSSLDAEDEPNDVMMDSEGIGTFGNDSRCEHDVPCSYFVGICI